MHLPTRYLKNLSVALLTVLTLAGTSVRVLAQSATGTIEGRVVDQSGAVLPGVTVTVTQADTGPTRTVDTDDEGLFRRRCCRSASTSSPRSLPGSRRGSRRNPVDHRPDADAARSRWR